jgi:hypothetical protein
LTKRRYSAPYLTTTQQVPLSETHGLLAVALHYSFFVTPEARPFLRRKHVADGTTNLREGVFYFAGRAVDGGEFQAPAAELKQADRERRT